MNECLPHSINFSLRCPLDSSSITNNTSINLNKNKHPVSVKHYMSGIESTKNPPNELFVEEFSRKEIPAQKQRLIESLREILSKELKKMIEHLWNISKTRLRVLLNTDLQSIKMCLQKWWRWTWTCWGHLEDKKVRDSSSKKVEIFNKLG